jgi:DNA-binding response OmpR family regulator
MSDVILIIEDDEGAADLAKAVLTQDGFSVLVAEDGKKGLALAREHKPALALVDLMLPGMHGFTVCERLRSELGDAAPRILVVTSKAYTQDVDSAKDAGADSFLTKPYQPDELVARVHALIDGQSETADTQPTPSSPA